MLVSPNLNPNKHWILVENKVLIKPKQVLGCSWCKRNKVYKFDSYAAVRSEEEKKILQVRYKVYL
jgi:hypothetical protein